MTTATEQKITVTDTMTGQELKSTEVRAEAARQDEQLPTAAELAAMESKLKDGIAEFRAELDAIRDSGILDFQHVDAQRRRRDLLRPLAQPQLWVPKRPPTVTPEQYMTAPDMPRRERRPHRSWWRRNALELTAATGLGVVAAVVAAVAGVL